MGQHINKCKPFCNIFSNSNPSNTQYYIEQAEKMHDILETFFLTPTDITCLYAFFKKISSSTNEELTIHSLFSLIKVNEHNKEMLPFIKYFYYIIDKRTEECVTFEELLPFLLTYCFSSSYQLVEFVFNLIDSDHNQLISLNEIEEMFSQKNNNSYLFFINNIKRIHYYKGNDSIRGDQMKLDDFVLLCNEMPFLYYPAVKFQKLLRENYIGEAFWVELEKNIKNKYQESLNKENDLKLYDENQDIRNTLVYERIKKFNQRWELEKKNQESKCIYQEKIRLGIPRLNSDTALYFANDGKNTKQRSSGSNGVGNNQKRKIESSKDVNINL